MASQNPLADFCKRPIKSKTTETSTFNQRQHQLNQEKAPNQVFRSPNFEYNFVGCSGDEIIRDLILSHGVKEICMSQHRVNYKSSRVTHSFIVGNPGAVAYGNGYNSFESLYTSPYFTTILPRSEQGAGHMAEGYARATGKPGVVSQSVLGVQTTSFRQPFQENNGELLWIDTIHRSS